eukprot:7427920-Pyramimonas_sp.AAC.1
MAMLVGYIFDEHYDCPVERFRRGPRLGVRSLPESSGVFHSAAPVAVGPSAYWSSPESRALGNVSECVQYVRMCAMRPNVCDVSECVQCVRMCSMCPNVCQVRAALQGKITDPAKVERAKQVRLDRAPRGN